MLNNLTGGGKKKVVSILIPCHNEELSLPSLYEELRKLMDGNAEYEWEVLLVDDGSTHLPVLCFDCCGMSAVIDEQVGVKVPLTTPKQSVRDFAAQIEHLYNNRCKLEQLSTNCARRQEELSWSKKAETVAEQYRKMATLNHKI